MADLRLAVNEEYFRDIQRGSKKFEYRLYNDYWRKRLIGKSYDRLIITLGYPKADDMSRTLVFPYKGYRLDTITHKHFGKDPVKVFAIILDKSQ